MEKLDLMEVLDDIGRYKYDYGLTKDDIEFAVEKINRARLYLDNNFITLPDGKPAVLSQIVSNWYINPHRYISEIKHRIYSQYEYAKAHNLEPVFITITLPSEYHKHKLIEVKGRLVKVKNKNYNPEFENLTPKELVLVLSKYFKKILDTRFYKSIPKHQRLYFKIIEPHKTGEPHLHAMFYLPKDKVQKFISYFEKLFPEPQGFIETDIINPVHYLIKYILKNIDDYRHENKAYFRYSPLSLWYIRWGIRRFSMSRTFVRIDLYRKLNGKFTLLELTNLVKNQVIDYYYEPITRQITDIFLNDDLIGAIPIWSKREQVFYKQEFYSGKPKMKNKLTPVYDENNRIIAYTDGKIYIKVNPDKKSIVKMTPSERYLYERELLNEFDNPFLDEQDLETLIDRLAVFNKYVDEDYKLREVPLHWLRGWDLNPRPPGYEPGELPGCSTPRHSGWAGRIRTSE